MPAEIQLFKSSKSSFHFKKADAQVRFIHFLMRQLLY